MLDIETENTGADIMNDNKRIISIQLMNGNNSSIFYDGSKINNITAGKNELQSLIENGKHFVGYNIRNFDVPLLDKFLDIKIPSSQIIEIGELQAMEEVRRKVMKKRVSLVQACDVMNVDCVHKALMNEKSEQIKKLPEVINNARAAGKNGLMI